MKSPIIEAILSRQGAHTTVRTLADLAKLPVTAHFALDIETRGADGLPGNNPVSPKHGICGVALCNMRGDAAYVVINGGDETNGVELEEFITYLNEKWLVPGCVCALHNIKFDWNFLMYHGMRYEGVRWVDTFILHTLSCHGVYVSNALKDIMKHRFGLTVDTESRIKKYLADNNTRDYGEIPVEIMAPYGCDDVRYTLVLWFSLAPDFPALKDLHDKHLENTRALNEAEWRGIGVNVKLLQERMTRAKEIVDENEKKILELLGSSSVDVYDDQKFLQHLHFINLHPGPVERYGEMQYVFDGEMLRAARTPMTHAFYRFYRAHQFRSEFSAKGGALQHRVAVDGDVCSIHPSYMLSMFSKGGLVQWRCPDFEDKVRFHDQIRELFAPRPGKRFVSLTAMDLPLHVLAYYCQDQKIRYELGKGGEYIANKLAERTGNNTSPEAASLGLRQIIDGHGTDRLLKRIQAARLAGFSKNNIWQFKGYFESKMKGFRAYTARLKQAIKSEGSATDLAGHQIIIPETKVWRAPAILIQSSVGGILGAYLRLFVRAARKTDTALVAARGEEFLFEVPEGDDRFVKAVREIADERLFAVLPQWFLWEQKTDEPWHRTHIDTHDIVTSKFY